MANFGDILSNITLLGHQSVRRNQEDTAFEAYDTDRLAVTVRVRSSDYAGGLTKGTVVYIGGATGNRPYVLKADATDESTSSKTFGVLAEDIAANGDGLCAIAGLLHGIALPTTTYDDGDSLWLSETAGEFVSTAPPAEPAHAVFIGWVARAHPTDGHIALQIQNGYELNELHGVLIGSTPANNDVLTYESSSGLWKNKAATGGSMSIGGTVTSGTTGSVLFIGASSALTQDNANLFFDDSNNRLGLGTSSPQARLHSYGSVEHLRLGYDANNFTKLTVGSGGILTIEAFKTNGTTMSDILHQAYNQFPTGGNVSTGGSWLPYGDGNNYLSATSTVFRDDSNATFLTLAATTSTYAEGHNLVFGTSTGTKIGTSTSQKIGFFNKSPVVQQSTAVGGAAFSEESGTTVNDASTFGGYTIGQVVQALQTYGLLA